MRVKSVMPISDKAQGEVTALHPVKKTFLRFQVKGKQLAGPCVQRTVQASATL